MQKYLLLLALMLVFQCKDSETKTESTQTETNETTSSSDDFREFLVLDSKHITNDFIWKDINAQMADFSEVDYNRLKPLIIEQDIPSMQKKISDGKFNYEQLTKFYLYRIRKYDRENDLSLNAVIFINPNLIEEAKQKDREFLNKKLKHPIFGMPILLKDNINAANMVTTAGAVALMENQTDDAFIVTKLKENGALILGKANLSEWAYYFCEGCPSGYSAVGGQTLNPYGRRKFDTGGSSSGSGVAAAANFAAATIGSETSGSILSPASQNSVVGLKPTIGLVSRSGIVPISSTLDTAGPITRNVIDNAIVLDAIFGEDTSDPKSIYALWQSGFYHKDLNNVSLKGKRFGVPQRDRFLQDTLFLRALDVLKAQGAELVDVTEEDLKLSNFLSLLNLDMKKDLPQYLENYASDKVEIKNVEDIVNFNLQDSLLRMPYGQELLIGIVADTGDAQFLKRIKDTLHSNGKQFFDKPMKTLNLDGFLSINNYHAGFAAVAEYPAITVPMGYTEEGKPRGLTIITSRLGEKQLLEWAYAYEQASKERIPPKNYN
ncbi:MAG: amidase [Winogradskyella sp.]|nr:amidase [Winogradskyella sp.]